MADAPRPTVEERALDGSEEPTALGASATVSAKRKRRAAEAAKGGAGTEDPVVVPPKATKRSSGSTAKGFLLVIVALLAFAAAPTVASAFKRTPSDKVGVSYSGGPFSGSSFQRVVDPGSGFFFNGFFSHLYLYPAGVSSYSMPSTEDDAGILEASEVVFPTSDQVPVTLEVSIHFRLNRDEMHAFHESVGAIHGAYTEDGWGEMERTVIRSSALASVQEAVRGLPSEAFATDPDASADMEAEASEILAARLLEATGGEFFCSPEHRPGEPCGSPTVVFASVSLPDWVGGEEGP